MTEREACNACGATDYKGELRICPWCENTKCSHCDMGVGCRCAACEEEALDES